jgi:hypothetical protein
MRHTVGQATLEIPLKSHTHLNLKPSHISASVPRDPLGLPAVAHPGHNLQLQTQRGIMQTSARCQPSIRAGAESVVMSMACDAAGRWSTSVLASLVRTVWHWRVCQEGQTVEGLAT